MSFIEDRIREGVEELKITPENEDHYSELMTETKCGALGPTFAELIQQVQQSLAPEIAKEIAALINFAAKESYQAGVEDILKPIEEGRRVFVHRINGAPGRFRQRI